MKFNARTLSSLCLLVFSVACSSAIPASSTPAPAVTQSLPNAPAATAAPVSTSSPSPDLALPTDTAIGFLVNGSEARYRVREQLAGVSFPSDAVGTTKNITGTLYVKADGTILPQSKFRVDMRTLQSDDDRRDNFLRQSVLNTRNFPFAEFSPKQVQGLALPPPAAGDLKFKLIGDLTIRDVTKSVTWEVEGKSNGGEGSGTATTSFNFAYFNLTQPRVPMVLSVQDSIKLEVEGVIRRQ